jgi:hypothetical protein
MDLVQLPDKKTKQKPLMRVAFFDEAVCFVEGVV